MGLMLSDYECTACGHIFEELADRDAPETVKCEQCGQFSCKRLITGTRIDPRLGVDPSYPTLYDAWARKRKQAAAQERKRKLEHEGR